MSVELRTRVHCRFYFGRQGWRAAACVRLLIASDLFEALLSRVIQRLHALFPPEVTGLVVLMVGIELIVLAAPRFLGFTGPGSSRNLLAIAVALLTLVIFGLSVSMVPGLYTDVPEAMSSLFSSSLSLATVLVVVLNVLLRIGIRTRVVLELAPRADSTEKIFTFMQVQGGAWGARKEVIDRATYAINEFMEAAGMLDLARGKIAAELALLRDRWGQMQEGLGQVAVVHGEAGIGKSRLVHEWKEELAEIPPRNCVQF